MPGWAWTTSLLFFTAHKAGIIGMATMPSILLVKMEFPCVPGLASNHDPLITASWVARIKNVRHYVQLKVALFTKILFRVISQKICLPPMRSPYALRFLLLPVRCNTFCAMISEGILFCCLFFHYITLCFVFLWFLIVLWASHKIEIVLHEWRNGWTGHYSKRE
jgi:hypothetical protein